MLDLQDVLLDAWSKLKPRLDADPIERQSRLARRHTARLTRPLREWTIALRANDRRLTPMRATIVPDDAPDRHQPDDVHVDKRLLHFLHRPVETDFPESSIPNLAKDLGVTQDAVRAAVKYGDLRQRRIKGMYGRHDRWGGIPFVHSPRPLNPNFGHRMRTPDPVWGGWWQDLPHALPDTFTQTLRRIPEYHTDHHANPRSTKNHPHRNHPRRAQQPRNGRTNDARPPHSHSEPGTRPSELPAFSPTPRFWGWRWLCPACQNTCRLIFLPTPLPLPYFVESFLEQHLPKEDLTPLPPTFACATCHRLRGQVSWASGDAWNHIITLITGGLLFGHEVPRPTWLKAERKLPHKRKSPTRPAPKRHEVEQRLLKGWSYPLIAKDLGISAKTVAYHVRAARRAHSCPTRAALLAHLRTTTPTTQSRSA